MDGRRQQEVEALEGVLAALDFHNSSNDPASNECAQAATGALEQPPENRHISNDQPPDDETALLAAAEWEQAGENTGESYQQTQSKHTLGATAALKQIPDDNDNNDHVVHDVTALALRAAHVLEHTGEDGRTIPVGQQDLGQAVIQAIENSRELIPKKFIIQILLCLFILNVLSCILYNT
jgi:hypothetical protein